MESYVYCLFLYETPFYIGKANDPEQRLIQHKVTFGPQITMEILDAAPPKEVFYWERFYIHLFLSWGFSLRNKYLYRKSERIMLINFSSIEHGPDTPLKVLLLKQEMRDLKLKLSKTERSLLETKRELITNENKFKKALGLEKRKTKEAFNFSRESIEKFVRSQKKIRNAKTCRQDNNQLIIKNLK